MKDKREKNSKEEQAFEALFVSSLRKLDDEDADIDRLGDPTPKEQAALDLVGEEFVRPNEKARPKHQPHTPEISMNTSNRTSGWLVLSVSASIVGVVVALMWGSGGLDVQPGNVVIVDEQELPDAGSIDVSELEDRLNELFPNSRVKLKVVDGRST